MLLRKEAAMLAAALLCAGNAGAQPATDWSKAQVLEFTMTNFAFTPNVLRFQHGTVYRLHLVNNGSGGHSFAASDLFAAGEVAPEDRAKIAKGEIEVAKGASVDVTFMPTRMGTYAFRCSHFLHATFGMTGNAVVE